MLNLWSVTVGNDPALPVSFNFILLYIIIISIAKNITIIKMYYLFITII